MRLARGVYVMSTLKTAFLFGLRFEQWERLWYLSLWLGPIEASLMVFDVEGRRLMRQVEK